MNKDMDKEDLSFEDVVEIIKGLIGTLLNYKFAILIIVILFGSLTSFYAWNKDPEYIAKTSFMLEDDGGNSGMGAVMGMASSLGFGGNSGSSLTPEKYIGVLTSDKILRKTLVSPYKDEFVITRFLKISEYFENENDMKKFDFVKMGPKEDSIVNEIIYSFRDMVLTEIGDEGIVSISLKSKNEVFSCDVNNILYNQVIGFFETNNVKKEQYIFNQLDSRVDSIKYDLEYFETEYAKEKDANLSVLRATNRVDELRLMRKVNILNVMYTETLKKLELARFNLLNKTPMVQLVDSPVLPIYKQSKSPKIYFIYGTFLGGILSVISVLFYDKIRQIKKSD